MFSFGSFNGNRTTGIDNRVCGGSGPRREYVLAKTEAQEDVRALDSLLKEQEKKKGSLLEAAGDALLETPKGILNIREIIAGQSQNGCRGIRCRRFFQRDGRGHGV